MLLGSNVIMSFINMGRYLRITLQPSECSKTNLEQKGRWPQGPSLGYKSWRTGSKNTKSWFDSSRIFFLIVRRLFDKGLLSNNWKSASNFNFIFWELVQTHEISTSAQGLDGCWKSLKVLKFQCWVFWGKEDRTVSK